MHVFLHVSIKIEHIFDLKIYSILNINLKNL
jgi:hypothetical protein